MSRKLFVVCILLCALPALPTGAQPYPGQLGINIGGNSETGGIFVDMAKEHHRYDRLPSGTMAYDSEGWPACDARLAMDFRLVAEWEGVIDDPEEYRHDNTGTYSCSFVGQADLAVTGASIQNQSYNSGTNTTTFELVITQPRVYSHIEFTNTQRTTGSGTDTGYTDLKMIKPGYPAGTTQTFTDNFINTLTSANWGAIRYMDTTGTNNQEGTYPETISWSDRKLTTDAAQVGIDAIGKRQAAAWEYVIELSNQVGIDPWINIPVSATTDYITQVATLFRDNLDPSLNVYVENSNEVWNGIFNQQAWTLAQANAMGINEHENYARRTIELAQGFESVFGAGSLNNRVRVMLCCHAPMLKWWVETYMISYIQNTMGLTPSDYIYGIARQTYFSTDGSYGTVDEILDRCRDDITSQIDQPTGDEAGRTQWVQKAAQWNLIGGACSYEGGFHVPSGGGTTNLANQITVHRVARAATELKYNYDDAFLSLGGNIAMQFTLHSSYHRYGCWGLTDDLADADRNYKFQACRDLTGGGGPQPPGQASNPTPANGATDVSVEADISWTAGSGATSHDVYFGQDSTPDSGEFQGNQTGTTFDPGTLAASTTYYWRIDSVNAQGTTTGVVWSFTTEAAPQPPGQASNPNPADSATGVSVDADLSWTAGSDATSHDVYFGTPSSPPFIQNQAGTTFDPGTLASETTYYWRIDEKNAVGTTTGVVWSFTTMPGAGTGTGLQGDYYDNMDFTAFVLSRVDATVNFDWGSGSPDPSIGADTFSVRWTGFVEPLYSETYTFYTTSDDGVRLWVDSQTVIDNWTDHAPTEDSGTITLSAGVQYDIQMDFYENGGGAVAQLEWSSASQAREVIPQSQLYEPTAPPPPGQATNPSPSNGATGVSTTADLSWTAGSGATSHDVYFGTDSTPDSGEFQGNQAGTTFDPGTLAYSTTYYWRIDSVNAGGTTTGVVWSFTTESVAPPAQATNPSPADGATNQSINVDLSWTAGSGATSHDVYFGTDPTPDSGEFQGNQAGTTFDPATLANDTTYYWRIDEVGPGGTTTGNVWSFTTEAVAAGDVEIIGSWTSGTTHAQEAGTDRALVFTAHAESSTADTDLGSVTYGGQSMTKVVDRIETTTYSAYTCAFILDEAGIDAASGSTFVVTWNTAPSETPAFTSVFLQSVNQSTLVGATGTGGSATTTAETPALSTNDGDMAIVAGTCGNSGEYSVINGFTEAIEVAPSSADGIGGYLPCTGADVTPGVSHTNVNRQSVIGFVVNVGVGGPPPPPDPATNPSPSDGATGVDIDADVSWTAGAGATSHDVYFGQTTSPPFVQNQAGTTYDPGTLSELTTYYWRIDEVGPGGTTTGTTWSFTTGSAAPPGILMAWEFAGDGGASSAPAETVAANISSTAPSGVASIGPGLSPIDYIGNALTGTQSTAMTLAEALSADDYLSWVIAPSSGHSMSISSIDIRPVSQNRTRTFTLFSSVNGFNQGSEIGSFSESANMNAPIHTVDVTGHDGLTGQVELRLYVHGYNDSYEAVGIGNGSGDDLVVNGTTN